MHDLTLVQLSILAHKTVPVTIPRQRRYLLQMVKVLEGAEASRSSLRC